MEYYVQRLAIFSAIALGLLGAPFVALQMVEGNFLPFFAIVAGMALIGIVFGLKGQIWFIIPVSTGLGWSLNFLPLGFNLIEISCLIALGYMVLVVMVMERRPIRVGPLSVWGPILILLLIIAYHWARTGAGFRVLGMGEAYGARRNFQIVLGVVPYLIILTCAYGRREDLNRVPFVFMLASLVGSLPFIISTFFPSTAGVLYYFTGNINMEILVTDSGFGEAGSDLKRLGALGPLGIAIQGWLIARYPVQTWWQPHRWWVALLSLAAFLLTARSGFRSWVFIFVLVSVVGAFLWLRWRSLWLVMLGAMVVGFLCAGQGVLFDLPNAVQRSLSFLPGQWSEQVLATAKSSNDFRQSVKDVYWAEFGWKSPIIGNGFAVDPRDVEQSLTIGFVGMDADDVARGFILRKDFHEGLLSIWDSTGAVGLFFFILLGLVFYFTMYRHRKQLTPRQIQPIQVWVIANFTASFSGHFLVFGDFKLLYPAVCTYFAYLLCSLAKQEASAPTPKSARGIGASV
jgi:hypothetical protein